MVVVQRSMVVAAMLVHNFIRKEVIVDTFFYQYENEDITLKLNNNDDDSASEADRDVNIEDQMEMSFVRDAIADGII